MLFDKTDAQDGSVYLLSLEKGPLAVSGARPFWIISEAGLTVGRAPDCTICLADQARLISRVQARVALIQGSVVWQQLGPNPSWVNEVQLEKGSQKILSVDDVIRLDPFVFRVAQRTSSAAAAGVIPVDWNPMALPFEVTEDSKSLPEFSGESAGEGLNRILKNSEYGIAFDSLPLENSLLADVSSIDDLLGSSKSGMSQSNPSTIDSPVWMDGLHARHGFSVSTESISEVRVDEPNQDSIETQSADIESRFLEGLGLRGWIINQAHKMSPNIAFEMGQSYRKALEGLIAMMSARTQLKNQIHAEHTTLVPRDNNPLKSCPNVDDLFLRWFASVDHSYLNPNQTIESTIQDLLEQQRATALALRMVIGRLAESFDPESLIAKAEVSSTAWDFRKYKARWEAHVEVYHSIFGDTADPVSALLSDTFRQAFEQYPKGTPS